MEINNKLKNNERNNNKENTHLYEKQLIYKSRESAPSTGHFSYSKNKSVTDIIYKEDKY